MAEGWLKRITSGNAGLYITIYLILSECPVNDDVDTRFSSSQIFEHPKETTPHEARTSMNNVT